MWDGFNFNHVSSVEFCVNVEEDGEFENYQIPADASVQDALRQMLEETRAFFDEAEEAGELGNFELSEKYAAREPLIADIDDEAMEFPRTLFAEEGWESNPDALHHPGEIPFYFGVFLDNHDRKLVAVRRATQFKGVLKSKLIRWFDDTLQLIENDVFRLDHEFDILITSAHVHILHPKSFEFIADIEQLIADKAHEKALSLGQQIKFARFEEIAQFCRTKKRAARLVASLSARDDLGEIKRSKFIAAAEESGVEIENVGTKIRPVHGSEYGFLELLDDRRYTTNIKTGAKARYLASSRKRLT